MIRSRVLRQVAYWPQCLRRQDRGQHSPSAYETSDPRWFDGKRSSALSALAPVASMSSKIRQREEQSYVTGFLNPDAVSVQYSTGDGGYLQSFGATAWPMRSDQQIKRLSLAELANSRQSVLRARRNRLVGPRPAERSLRLGYRPDDTNVGHDFIAFRPEYQLRVSKAPPIGASFETVASNPADVALFP